MNTLLVLMLYLVLGKQTGEFLRTPVERGGGRVHADCPSFWKNPRLSLNGFRDEGLFLRSRADNVFPLSKSHRAVIFSPSFVLKFTTDFHSEKKKKGAVNWVILT